MEKVTKQAMAMVTIDGLNDKIGNVSYYNPQGNGFHKPYSEDTARIIDEEVKMMIEQQYQRAIKILSENKDKLMQLAEILLQKEVIFKEDLEKIFGKRAFGDHVIPSPAASELFNNVPESLKPDLDKSDDVNNDEPKE